MGYYFYKYGSNNINLSLHEDFELNWFKPSLFQLKIHQGSSLIYFYWFIITLGAYEVFYIREKSSNKIVHYSNILPKTWQFPFMKKRELHIVSCHTDSNFRGRGLYPFAIRSIAQKYFDKCWIISDFKNTASNRGILKSGFQLVGEGFRNKWKRYIIK